MCIRDRPFERKLFERISKDSRIEFADGGQERQDSVYEGLKKTKGDYVLIHDGARPFVKRKHIDALLECLKVHSACLLMVPCKDTIKKVVNGKVVETLKRSELMQAQTPQAFHRDVIVDAYSQGILEEYQATDDAQMLSLIHIYNVGKKRPFVLVIPGGGYAFTSDREAEPIALKFNSIGFNSGVLWYTVMDQVTNVPHNALIEGAMAIKYIREHGEDWLIDTDNIDVYKRQELLCNLPLSITKS